MREAAIQVDIRSTPCVREVGRERTPVVVIDDFAVDTSEIIEHATHTAVFGADTTSAYPGVRAPLTRSHVIVELNAIYPARVFIATGRPGLRR